MKKYTQADVLTAISGSAGVLTVVSRRLGCAWHTALKYSERWTATRIALEAERQQILDQAEQNVLDAIADGDLPISKWYLTTKGRDRGYGDSVRVGFDDDQGGLILIRPGGRDGQEST